MNNVLIVDDEKKIREIISIFLKAEKFNALEAENGKDALKVFAENDIDLIVLDVMLPDYGGYEICKKIRETSDVPIIFLTALDDDDYHLMGYNYGADDYITKPFKASILIAKIKRLLDRYIKNNHKDKDFIVINNIKIDKQGYSLFVDEEEVYLAPKEYELLLLLIENNGRVLNREYLLERIWGYNFEGESRVVDNHIKKLRKKLGNYSDYIKTIITIGYKFESD